jgi:hypothetical protein
VRFFSAATPSPRASEIAVLTSNVYRAPSRTRMPNKKYAFLLLPDLIYPRANPIRKFITPSITVQEHNTTVVLGYSQDPLKGTEFFTQGSSFYGSACTSMTTKFRPISPG